MFGTSSKINPGLPPGSPLRVRTKDPANPGQGNGDVDAEDVVEAQRRRIVKMLLKGDIYGLPGSQGTKWSNFREWAKNQHPVLSMFFAHELHPFSRSERLSVMMCYLCWAFFITVMFEYGNSPYTAICNPGCNNKYKDEEEVICGPNSGPNEDEVTLDDYEWNCAQITPWWVLSFLIALVTVPYSTILKFLATCACAQSMPNCLKSCVECLGSMVLRLFGVLSVLWLTFGIMFAMELDGGMFLVTYLTGVVKSWMYWPILAGATFLYKYNKKKKAFDEANPGQVAMAWPINHQDPNMEVKVGKDGNPVAYLSPPGSPGRGQPQPGMNAIGFAGTPAASPSPLPHQGQFFGGGQPMMQPGSPLMSPASEMSNASNANNMNTMANHGMNNMYGGGAPPYPQLQQPGYPASYGAPQQGSAPQAMGSPPATYGGGGGVGFGLPPGWEAKIQPDGRMLYIDHNTKSSHWDPPLMQQPQQPQQQPPGSPPTYHQYMAGSEHPGSVPGGYGGMQQQHGGGYSIPQQNQQQAIMGGYPNPHQQQLQPPVGAYSTMGPHDGHVQQQPQSMGGYPVQQQQMGSPPMMQQQPQQLQGPASVEALAPKPVVMEFAVPDGCSAGDVVQINSPTGVISVTIPAGSSSGDTLQIPLPG